MALELAGSPFQVEVWTRPAGHPVRRNGQLSSTSPRPIGRPAAVRAVGAANGRNPISIIVPCHRVIGADGSLTGYGWGVDRKAWLLDHESGGAGTLFRASLSYVSAAYVSGPG